MRIHFVMACLWAVRLNGLHHSSVLFSPVSALGITARNRMTSTNEDVSAGQADIGAASSSSSKQDLTVGNMSWRTMLERSSNRSRKIRGSNYVQIATVDPATNEPRCRTVVFRGFQSLPTDHSLNSECDGLPCVAKMITDMNSEKVSQISHHSNHVAELLWWFPRSSEQYRVRGDIVFVGNGQFETDNDEVLRAARKQMWGNISDSARESFLSDAIPGQRFVELTTCPPTGGRGEDGKVLPAPDNFLLMLLRPRHVDYLSLSNNYRQVDRCVDGSWKSQRVMP